MCFWSQMVDAMQEEVSREYRDGMMIQKDTVHALTSLPATDLNFVSCLKSSTNFQIEMALEVMQNRYGKDKGRIAACERELKRRNK